MATVRLNLEPLKRFAAAIRADLRQTGNGPIRRAMLQWAVRYRSFAQQRFDTHSKGGGDWAPLAESTKRGRRKARKGRLKGAARSFSILRDTGLMFQALNPVWNRKPGALQKDITFGVRVGYGGPSKYPTKAAKSPRKRKPGLASLVRSIVRAFRGPTTIADIARFHDTGAGNLPKRQIIVVPDAKTLKAMAGDMERGLGEMARITGVR